MDNTRFIITRDDRAIHPTTSFKNLQFYQDYQNSNNGMYAKKNMGKAIQIMFSLFHTFRWNNNKLI